MGYGICRSMRKIYHLLMIGFRTCNALTLRGVLVPHSLRIRVARERHLMGGYKFPKKDCGVAKTALMPLLPRCRMINTVMMKHEIRHLRIFSQGDWSPCL